MFRFILLLGVLWVSGCGKTADETARLLFDVADNEALDTVSLREAVLTVLPVGTPRSAVVRYLENRGATAGSSGAIHYDTTAAALFLRIEGSRRSIVYATWAINFAFDEPRTVRSVRVKHRLTGP